MKPFKLAISLLLLGAFFASSSFAQKITAEDLIAKHLESVGTAELRTKVKNQAILGAVNFSLALDKNSVYTGNSAFAAEGMKRLYGLTFDKSVAADYPLERIIYNEKDLKIAAARLGQRSALGNYLFRNERIIKDGIFGGSMFLNWAMTNLSYSKAKIEVDQDRKKINGTEVYQVTYTPKKGFNVSIKMYFDATTFRHVRTEYKSEIGAQMGRTPEMSSGQSETRENLVEDFSDFKSESGLTLPHTYRIYYTVSGRTNKEFVYNFKFNNYYFNQNLGEDPFELNQK